MGNAFIKVGLCPICDWTVSPQIPLLIHVIRMLTAVVLTPTYADGRQKMRFDTWRDLFPNRLGGNKIKKTRGCHLWFKYVQQTKCIHIYIFIFNNWSNRFMTVFLPFLMWRVQKFKKPLIDRNLDRNMPHDFFFDRVLGLCCQKYSYLYLKEPPCWWLN